MTEELWRLSAVEVAAGIHSQKFSAESVIASVAESIHDCNRDLTAIVYDYSAQAIHEARAADRALAAGERIGPLHGVPVTIKSNIDVAGTPTPNGLPAFKITSHRRILRWCETSKMLGPSSSGVPIRRNYRCD